MYNKLKILFEVSTILVLYLLTKSTDHPEPTSCPVYNIKRKKKSCRKMSSSRKQYNKINGILLHKYK